LRSGTEGDVDAFDHATVRIGAEGKVAVGCDFVASTRSVNVGDPADRAVGELAVLVFVNEDFVCGAFLAAKMSSSEHTEPVVAAKRRNESFWSSVVISPTACGGFQRR
jgi:hypothetical protein